ncbi:phospholipase D family protein [Geomonas sp. Red32]|nr:phospholipase D family protein [Geomonas sp. Red32]MCM0081240.1 phospholipase D family protein [Geomonas sp. Red32]
MIVTRFLVAAFMLLFVSAPLTAAPFPSTGTVEVYFSPHGGAADAVIREIGKARQEILVQAYSFTSKPIAKALLEAHKRGVKVVAIMDKSQRTQRYSGATFLANSGIEVLIDERHAIAHSKIMIIDRATIITGSFNFTRAAEEKNAENLLVLKGNSLLVQKYLANFEAQRALCVPFSN